MTPSRSSSETDGLQRLRLCRGVQGLGPRRADQALPWWVSGRSPDLAGFTRLPCRCGCVLSSDATAGLAVGLANAAWRANRAFRPATGHEPPKQIHPGYPDQRRVSVRDVSRAQQPWVLHRQCAAAGCGVSGRRDDLRFHPGTPRAGAGADRAGGGRDFGARRAVFSEPVPGAGQGIVHRRHARAVVPAVAAVVASAGVLAGQHGPGRRGPREHERGLGRRPGVPPGDHAADDLLGRRAAGRGCPAYRPDPGVARGGVPAGGRNPGDCVCCRDDRCELVVRAAAHGTGRAATGRDSTARPALEGAGWGARNRRGEAEAFRFPRRFPSTPAPAPS